MYGSTITSRSVLMLLPSESLEHLQTEAPVFGTKVHCYGSVERSITCCRYCCRYCCYFARTIVDPSCVNIPKLSFAFKMAELAGNPFLFSLNDSCMTSLSASAPLVICLL